LATKTTGAEFMGFYNAAFWPDGGIWYDDQTVKVAGE